MADVAMVLGRGDSTQSKGQLITITYTLWKSLFRTLAASIQPLVVKKNAVIFDLQIRLLKDGTAASSMVCAPRKCTYMPTGRTPHKPKPKRAVSVSETNWSSWCKGQTCQECKCVCDNCFASRQTACGAWVSPMSMITGCRSICDLEVFGCIKNCSQRCLGSMGLYTAELHRQQCTRTNHIFKTENAMCIGPLNMHMHCSSRKLASLPGLPVHARIYIYICKRMRYPDSGSRTVPHAL